VNRIEAKFNKVRSIFEQLLIIDEIPSIQ